MFVVARLRLKTKNAEKSVRFLIFFNHACLWFDILTNVHSSRLLVANMTKTENLSHGN